MVTDPVCGELPTYIITQRTAMASSGAQVWTHLREVPGIDFFPLPSIQRFPERNCVFASSYDTRLLETGHVPPQGTHVHGTGSRRVLTQNSDNGYAGRALGVRFVKRMWRAVDYVG